MLRVRSQFFVPISNRRSLSTSPSPSPNSRALRLEVFQTEWLKQQEKLNSLSASVNVKLQGIDEPVAVDALWKPVAALKNIPKSPLVERGVTFPPDQSPIIGVRVKGQIRSLIEPVGSYLSVEEMNDFVHMDFIRFGTPEGNRLFWHSSAHILGSALEHKFGNDVFLTDGPAVTEAEGGFFYEFESRSGERISDELYPLLEPIAKEIINGKHPFERVEVNLDTAARIFSENKYKLEVLARLPQDAKISLYRTGNFVDLCMGPHVPHTGYMKGFKLFRCGGSQWSPHISLEEYKAGKYFRLIHAASKSSSSGLLNCLTDSAASASSESKETSFTPSVELIKALSHHDFSPQRHEQLHRLYGVAFPTSGQLQAWQKQVDEARRRDHRVIGREQGLFFFHDLSPGSAFLLPHGTRIYNRLLSMIRTEYRRRGYHEIRSPLVFKADLWKISGHLDAYAENMFTVAPGIDGLLQRQSLIDNLNKSAERLNVELKVSVSSSAPTSEIKNEVDENATLVSCSSETHSSLAECDHSHNHSPQPYVDTSKEPQSTQEEQVSMQLDLPLVPNLLTSQLNPESLGLKPMNCPGHCLVFQHGAYSYRDLPVRFADFSSLHRNEASGALGGLTRLRRFSQDDAHIFCRQDQLGAEVQGCLDFVRKVYGIFGFPFRLKLSTRPEKFVGDLKVWDEAEQALSAALQGFLEGLGRKKHSDIIDYSEMSQHHDALESTDANKSPADMPSTDPTATAEPSKIAVEIDEGGGAFYGPKIDVFVRDAIGREHQCATVQLDFQLPIRFGLSYKGEHGPETPVIIHRAVLGSVERILGILIEHTAGKWPFWLSPRQLVVCSVTEDHATYANEVVKYLKFVDHNEQGVRVDSMGHVDPISVRDDVPSLDTTLHVDVDTLSQTVSKRVRNAQALQYNIIAIVGNNEMNNNTITARFRDLDTFNAFTRAWGVIDVAAARICVESNKEKIEKKKVILTGKNKKNVEETEVFDSPMVTLPLSTFREICMMYQRMRI